MMCYVLLMIWCVMWCWCYDVLCGVGGMMYYVVLVIWCCTMWCWWYDVLCGVGDMMSYVVSVTCCVMCLFVWPGYAEPERPVWRPQGGAWNRRSRRSVVVVWCTMVVRHTLYAVHYAQASHHVTNSTWHIITPTHHITSTALRIISPTPHNTSYHQDHLTHHITNTT